MTAGIRTVIYPVDDLARACELLLDSYDDPAPINVGVGEDVTIADLADLIAKIVGYTGRIEFDPSKPDGTPRKLLDVSRINALGFKPRVNLADGIATVYDWYERSGRREGA